MSDILQARQRIRALLDDSNPAESPTTYYALFHPKERSAIFTHEDDKGKTRGFVGRFQTGADLFRPLVTLVCPNPEVAAGLLARGLVGGRPYILFAGLNQLPMVGGSLYIENQRILRIYTLNPARFSPQINVLVEQKTGADGLPRCEVNMNEQKMAVAGVNWRSPAFAEIYVHTEPEARQRGWGRSVVSCVVERLLKEGILPVYLVENNNEASKLLIESLGFADSGSRQVYADAVYKP